MKQQSSKTRTAEPELRPPCPANRLRRFLRTRSRLSSSALMGALLVCMPVLLHAETIVLDASSCDRMAGIAEAAPRQSWALTEIGPGMFSNGEVSLAQGRSLLIRFPLESIPKGNRIVHAEFIVPIIWGYGNEPRFYLWRTLADWGAGVCHLYRQTSPKLVPWTKPHAGGISSDRATRPTDIVRVSITENKTINVTEDVELWYTGAAANNGWLLTVEDPGNYIRVYSPVFAYLAMWQLRITFEPEGQ